MVIIILLGTLTLPGFTNEKNNFSEIENYIYHIYEKYQKKDYKTVYNNMHPEIRKVLEKEKYIKYQEKNSTKYNIKISEVEVLKVTILNNMPDTFEDIIAGEKNHKIYEITIKYKANYENAGNEKKKTIEKKTYVLSNNEQYYLLWDPNIINKD